MCIRENKNAKPDLQRIVKGHVVEREERDRENILLQENL